MMRDLDGVCHDIRAAELARLPHDCNLKLNIDGHSVATKNIYGSGHRFYDSFRLISGIKRSRNVQFHMGTLIMDFIILSTALHVFPRLGKAAVLDKFLLNCLQTLLRTSKLYCFQIIIQCEFAKSVMPASVYRTRYDEVPAALRVGS